MKLKKEEIGHLLEKHRKIILQDFEYDMTNPNEYRTHAGFIRQLGNDYMGREFRDFEVDEYNSKVLAFLLYYFNGCRLAEQVFPNEIIKSTRIYCLLATPAQGKLC